MLKYNDNNIYSGYIKQLLASFNLPQCQIGKKDFYRNADEGIYQSQHYIENNSLYFYDAKEEKSKRISSYKEDDKILNITKNLEIRSNIYDSYTHEYLGDYLRYIRDYKHVDLMSMYNCFSNTVANVNIYKKDSLEFVSSNDNYTVFAIPVKFKQNYTIAIDWHGNIEICCGFYQNGKRFDSKLYTPVGEFVFEELTHTTYSNTRFRDPILYDKLMNLTSLDYSNEKCLKMFLKIPNSCKSTIVVLEGDYRRDARLLLENKKQVLANKSVLYYPEIDGQLSNELYDSNTASSIFDYRTKLQLLQCNSGEMYLLADRLVEYLSNQVVSPLDTVIDDIRRLQKKIYKEYGVEFDIYGIWDENQRKVIYQYIVKYGLQNKYNDLLAYLDKDIERNSLASFDIEYYKEGGEMKENDVWQIR